jgi:ABC-2 type transport system permease protein
MLNLTLGTLYKISKSFAVKLSLILVTVAAILYFYCAKSIADGSMAASMASSITGLADVLMLWLFGPLVIGIIICDDFDSKVIHTAVSCSRGRISIVASKVIISIFLVMLLSLPYLILTVIFYANDTSFAGAESAACSIYISSLLGNFDAGVGKLLIVCILTALVNAAQIAICIPIAFKVRKPVVLMGIGFALGMLGALITAAINKVDFIADIFKYTPYSYNVSNVNLSADAGDLVKALVVSIVFIILIAVITHLLFRKQEIK